MGRDELLVEEIEKAGKANLDAGVLFVKTSLGLKNPEHVVEGLVELGLIDAQDLRELQTRVESEVQGYAATHSIEEMASDLQEVIELGEDLSATIDAHRDDIAAGVEVVEAGWDTIQIVSDLLRSGRVEFPLSVMGSAFAGEIDNRTLEQAMDVKLSQDYHAARARIDQALEAAGEPPLSPWEDAVLAAAYGNASAADDPALAYQVEATLDTAFGVSGNMHESLAYVHDVYRNIHTPGMGPDADRAMDDLIRAAGQSESPFTETGELSIEYILSQDTSEARAAFDASEANPGFAANVSPEFLQAQKDAAYFKYLKEQAANQAARESGIDVSEILDLNVPGNPNAPGYYPEIPDTVFYEPLPIDNDATNAGFAGFGEAQQEADNPGSTGWASEDPWSPGEQAWHQNLSNDLEVGYSAYQLYRAIEYGDSAQQLSAGFDLVQDLSEAGWASEEIDKLANSNTAASVMAFVSLADAIDEGRLLALAVVAGLVSLETVASPREPVVVQSVFEHARAAHRTNATGHRLSRHIIADLLAPSVRTATLRRAA